MWCCALDLWVAVISVQQPVKRRVRYIVAEAGPPAQNPRKDSVEIRLGECAQGFQGGFLSVTLINEGCLNELIEQCVGSVKPTHIVAKYSIGEGRRGSLRRGRLLCSVVVVVLQIRFSAAGSLSLDDGSFVGFLLIPHQAQKSVEPRCHLSAAFTNKLLGPEP